MSMEWNVVSFLAHNEGRYVLKVDLGWVDSGIRMFNYEDSWTLKL